MSTTPSASSEDSPYESPTPSQRIEPPVAGSPGNFITQRAVELLAQTRPSVRFLSVLGFIVATSMVFLGLLGALVKLTPPRDEMSAVAYIVYVPLSLLVFFPSLFLRRFANRINNLQMSGAAADLESALEAQRSFWRFMSIAIKAVLLFYAVLLVLMALIVLMIGTNIDPKFEQVTGWNKSSVGTAARETLPRPLAGHAA